MIWNEQKIRETEEKIATLTAERDRLLDILREFRSLHNDRPLSVTFHIPAAMKKAADLLERAESALEGK
jgi:hypothetical protein